MIINALITDLAFILILGAIVTLLFKWIKQPVILGYIVAGFLASPNFEALPSVTDEGNIEFWAQIGIIVLLFSLGLEFSFKKLLNTGGSAVITALIIVVGMMGTGFCVGRLLGFQTIDSLFLGGMLSMSSTTIIIKALTDLGLKQRKFASLVFAVLVVEDLFAVVMMVLLSSIAVNNSVEGGELLLSISKLIFFLVIWFLVGIFLLPTLLNRSRKFLNDETLLIVSMGLCLGMAIFSVACGFSLALGAFVMGSILAGTSMAERIEHVVEPVKNLFGAVFFISVGMMVQPDVIVANWGSILLLSAVVIVGMITFGTFGMLVTGQSLKIAIESGFSLTQIGEFAFIIASLGMSLGVLDQSIYPIVVAVSVVTTFTTPYFIKLSDPTYRFIERHLPSRLHFLIDRYNQEAVEAVDKRAIWWRLVKRSLGRILLYSIVLVAITLLSVNLLLPWLKVVLPGYWQIVGAAITLSAMAPFLMALSLPSATKSDGITVATAQTQTYRVPIVVIRIFRVLLMLAFVVNMLSRIWSMRVGFTVGIALVVVFLIMVSGRVKHRMRRLEDRFISNLNERELRRSGRANSLVSDLHLAYVRVGAGSPLAGEKLGASQIQKNWGVNVSSITRGERFIAVPRSSDRIYPGDVVGLIGTDENIQKVLPVIEQEPTAQEAAAGARAGDYTMGTIQLSDKSPLIGETIVTADVRGRWTALVLAVERDGEFQRRIAETVLQPGDKIYLYASRASMSLMQ